VYVDHQTARNPACFSRSPEPPQTPSPTSASYPVRSRGMPRHAGTSFCAMRHAPAVAVASLLRRSFGPDVDVEEGVQETFLVAFEELGQLREPAAVRVWLLRIALRTCRRLWWTRRVRELLVPAGAEASPYWGEDDLGPGFDGDERAAIKHRIAQAEQRLRGEES